MGRNRRALLAALPVTAATGCLRLQSGDATATGGESGTRTDSRRESPTGTESETGTPSLEATEVWETGDYVSLFHVRGSDVYATSGTRVWKVGRDGTYEWESTHLPGEVQHLGVLTTSPTHIFAGARMEPIDSGYCRLYAFDRGDGSLEWTFDGPDDGIHNVLEGVAVLDDSLVSFVTHTTGEDDGQEPIIHTLDQASGEQRWSVRWSDTFVNGPVVHGEDIYVRYGDDVFLHALDARTGDVRSTISESVGYKMRLEGDVLYTTNVPAAVDLQSGELRWRNDESGGQTVPVVGDEHVYFGTRSGWVVALDRETGKEQWRSRLNRKTRRPVSVGDYGIWASDTSGTVYAFDGETGTRRFERQVEDRETASGPAFEVVGDHLLVGQPGLRGFRVSESP